MKIEDLKVGTKLKVIKNYKGNGIMLRQGEVIKIKKALEGETYSVSTPYYYSPIVVPKEALLECCVRITFIKCDDGWREEIYGAIFNKEARNNGIEKTVPLSSRLCTDQLLHANSISSKTTINRSKYNVEISLTFDGKKYTVGDFVRVKVDGDNYYGKIKEVNATTIRLTKLSSNNVYTIELDKIAEMENIG
ncbi:hypothetical protein AM596_15010 [Clostridium perfringens CP4]|uniref:hypothetical protein n=1 Tax=Clostridium perfringens TaxID=1502 RepID=UPI00070737E8|nr:hypothetical protein [Clostridium perfringens]KQC91344.1 hypothetical protein AM596_15010 [Clostridium perfringens CP4]